MGREYAPPVDTRDLSGKLVVVTGAASGMGRALAELCARRGARLGLCDLNEAGLAETVQSARAHGSDVTSAAIDVSSRADMGEFAQRVHAEQGVVDLLINNAGVGLGADFLNTTLDDWDWIIDVNLKGVVHGCHFFVPAMVERGQGGHVANLASIAGLTATQLLTAYSATKFAVVGLSGAMRTELSPHGIGVTALCPGVINTAIARKTRARGWQQVLQDAGQSEQLFRLRAYSAERAADRILEHVHHDRAIGTVAPEAWAMFMLKRFAPQVCDALDRQLGAQARARARKLSQQRG